MAILIQLKRSSVAASVPSPSALEAGELAVNTADAKIFMETSGGTVVEVGMTPTERSKLSGISAGATANDTDANLRNRANHTGSQSADTISDGTTNKAYTATEKTKLAGVAASADVTGAAIAGATAKTSLVDADTMPLSDSAASSAIKKITWANIKSAIAGALGAMVAAATAKTTPGDADMIVIADSAASNATKKVALSDLKAYVGNPTSIDGGTY